MKKNYLMGLIATGAVLLASCSKDPESGQPSTGVSVEGKGKVTFSIQSDAVFNTQTRAGLVGSDLVVLAFLNDGEGTGAENYIYTGEMIKGDNFTVDQSAGTLSGSAYLVPGDYKFLAYYGLDPQPTASMDHAFPASWPASGSYYRGTDYILNTRLANGGMDELFLPYLDDGDYFAAQTPVTIVADGVTGNSVEIELRRAVGKVSVLFIMGEDLGEGETPRYVPAEEGNVFGNYGYEDIDLTFTNLNSGINYIADVPTGAAYQTFGGTYDAATYSAAVSGTGADIAADGFWLEDGFDGDWNTVTTTDLGLGSAYVDGPFLMPTNGTQKAGVGITVASGNMIRSIPPVNVDIERNKVTLVKVWVLGPSIYHTNTRFVVNVEQVWNDPNIEEVVVN